MFQAGDALAFVCSLSLVLTGCGSSSAGDGGGADGGPGGSGGSGAAGASGGAGGASGGMGGASGGTGGAGGSAGQGSGCDCVPVSLATDQIMKLANPGDCSGSALYAKPNPSLCPEVDCNSVGYSFYSGACYSGVPSTDYTSFLTDYSSCINLPADGDAGYFQDVKLYWSSTPSSPAMVFDETYCPVTPSAHAGECDSKSFCVPKDLGPVCVPTYGSDPPPAGWTEGMLYQESQCGPTDSELTDSSQFAVYSSAGCTGAPVSFQDGTCLSGAKSFRPTPAPYSKVAQNVEVLDNFTVPVICRN